MTKSGLHVLADGGNPELLSQVGDGLRGSGVKMVIVGVLDDQSCHVGFGGKKEWVLRCF